jgi:hypothetical protein
MRLNVLCNAGPHGEETPWAFHLGGRRLSVISIVSRWTDTPHRYFEVRVDDGRRFVLRHETATRCWELAAVFAAPKPQPKPSKPKLAVARPVSAAAPAVKVRWFAAWLG